MPITEAQRELRQKHIGSSDMAAILGLDPYRSAWDVWAEKTGKVEPAEESDAMYLGSTLEDGVLKYAADKLGALKRNQYRSRPDLHLGSNIDAIIIEDGEPVEAKTAGIARGFVDGEQWGDDGTDEVPERVIIQTHVHMLCMNGQEPQRCHVPALLGGRGFRLYHVDRNTDVCDVIAEAAIGFWRCVESDTPPSAARPTLEVVKRARRVPNKVVQLDPAIWNLRELHRLHAAEAAKRQREAEAMLLAALGDAEAGRLPDGSLVTYYETQRKGYTVAPTSFRSLRHKKAPRT